jgi:hypothetical protein
MLSPWHLRQHRVFVDNLYELQSPLGFPVVLECLSVSLHSFCVPYLYSDLNYCACVLVGVGPISVGLVIVPRLGTTLLWTVVAIINSPDCRNNLSKLLADACIQLLRMDAIDPI